LPRLPTSTWPRSDPANVGDVRDRGRTRFCSGLPGRPVEAAKPGCAVGSSRQTFLDEDRAGRLRGGMKLAEPTLGRQIGSGRHRHRGGFPRRFLAPGGLAGGPGGVGARASAWMCPAYALAHRPDVPLSEGDGGRVWRLRKPGGVFGGRRQVRAGHQKVFRHAAAGPTRLNGSSLCYDLRLMTEPLSRQPKSEGDSAGRRVKTGPGVGDRSPYQSHTTGSSADNRGILLWAGYGRDVFPPPQLAQTGGFWGFSGRRKLGTKGPVWPEGRFEAAGGSSSFFQGGVPAAGDGAAVQPTQSGAAVLDRHSRPRFFGLFPFPGGGTARAGGSALQPGLQPVWGWAGPPGFSGQDDASTSAGPRRTPRGHPGCGPPRKNGAAAVFPPGAGASYLGIQLTPGAHWPGRGQTPGRGRGRGDRGAAGTLDRLGGWGMLRS